MNKSSELRKECRATQEEWAAVGKVKQSSVSNWERGVTDPRIKTAKRIAKHYGFDWTLFFKEV